MNILNMKSFKKAFALMTISSVISASAICAGSNITAYAAPGNGINFNNTSSPASAIDGVAVIEGTDSMNASTTQDPSAATQETTAAATTPAAAVNSTAATQETTAAATTPAAALNSTAAAQETTAAATTPAAANTPAAAAAQETTAAATATANAGGPGSGVTGVSSSGLPSGPVSQTGSSTGTTANILNSNGYYGISGNTTGSSDRSSVTYPSGYYFGNIGTYTYEMMVQDLSLLKQKYPSMSLDSIGTTLDGRQLYHVVVGNPNASRKILVHAGIHAREYIVCQLAMQEIGSLLEMQNIDTTYGGKSMKALLQNTCIHFVPMLNPDGISLCQFGTSALKTQAALLNLQKMQAMDGVVNTASYVRTFKSNLNGVNLNRNFDANWVMAKDTKNHPSSVEYKGPTYESEVESKAIADLTRKVNFARTISYHTQGRVIYWNFGQTGDFRTASLQFAQLVGANTGYEVSDTFSPNDAAGFKDWAVQKLSIPSVTIECGKGTSPVPESQITAIWAQNRGILPDTLLTLN